MFKIFSPILGFPGTESFDCLMFWCDYRTIFVRDTGSIKEIRFFFFFVHVCWNRIIYSGKWKSVFVYESISNIFKQNMFVIFLFILIFLTADCLMFWSNLHSRYRFNIVRTNIVVFKFLLNLDNLFKNIIIIKSNINVRIYF